MLSVDEYLVALQAGLAENPAIAAMPQEDAAAALNALSVTRAVDAPTGAVRGLLLRTGEWGKLRRLTQDATADPALAAIAWNLTETVDAADIHSFALSDPDAAETIGAGLDALVARNVIQASTKAALMGLGQAVVPVFDRQVSGDDVWAARNPGLLHQRG